jgi:NitT/TauT family transport system permease protein
MLRKPIAWYWHLILGTAGVLSMLGLYSWYSWHRQANDPDDRAVPSFRQIWNEGGVLKAFTPDDSQPSVTFFESPRAWFARLMTARYFRDMIASFYRLFVGLGVSVAVAVFIGLLMGCYAPLEAFFFPQAAYLSKIPGTLLMTVFAALIGYNLGLYIVMIAFGVVPTLTQTVYHAAKDDVPEELLYKARTLGASELECIWSVIFKHILPKVLDAVRLSIGPALIFLFAAEYIWGQDERGVGSTVRLFFHKGVTGSTTAYLYIMSLGVFGLVGDYLLRTFQHWLCPWYEQHH